MVYIVWECEQWEQSYIQGVYSSREVAEQVKTLHEEVNDGQCYYQVTEELVSDVVDFEKYLSLARTYEDGAECRGEYIRSAGDPDYGNPLTFTEFPEALVVEGTDYEAVERLFNKKMREHEANTERD